MQDLYEMLSEVNGSSTYSSFRTEDDPPKSRISKRASHKPQSDGKNYGKENRI